jgi:hypothetical protein
VRKIALALITAVLLGVASVSPASAAPPWTAPVALNAPPSPRVEANQLAQAELVPRLSAGSAGLQLASWWSAGETAGAGTRIFVALDGDRTVRVRSSRVVAASSRYARTRILHLGAKRVGDYRGFPTVRLGYQVGTADLSSFGATRALGGKRTIRGAPVLAVNESGAAIAAWRHVRRGQSDEIQISVRPASGRFGPVRTVQRNDVDSETTIGVGIDAGGRAVVAYARNTAPRGPARLAVRVIETRSGELEDESRVVPPAGQRGPTEIVVGTQPRNRARAMVVAWRAFPVSEGPTGTVDTAAAVLPAGAVELDAAQPLAKGALVAYPRGPIAATVDAAGRPVVAWGELTPGPAGRPELARTHPDGRARRLRG